MTALNDEVVGLTHTLVRIPSPVGCPSFDPIIDELGSWLAQNRLDWQRLTAPCGRTVGVFVTIDSGRPGPLICLDAPIDTAPVRSDQDWKFDPFGAEVVDGKMYGRGVADCKVAVSIFCHLAREVSLASVMRRGKLHILFDADEHSGNFGGIKAFVEGRGIRPDFVAIGYPGNEAVRHGARGIYRVTITCFGEEQHSGRRAKSPDNSLLRAAQVAIDLDNGNKDLPMESDPDFRVRELGPKISVTRISGGAEKGFTQIPGSAEVDVDVRLTPAFGAEAATQLIRYVTAKVDARFPGGQQSQISPVVSWPPYKLDPLPHEASVLLKCARDEFCGHIDFKICGPSNVGNYLWTQKIPATCGFGVAYDNEHGADEYMELATVRRVYDVYRNAVEEWLM